MILLGSQQGCIEIGLESEFFNHLENLFLALTGHFSPVVQNSVDRSFGNTGRLRHIIDSHLVATLDHT